MKPVLSWPLKIAALTGVLIIGQMVGGMIGAAITHAPVPGTGDGPLNGMQAQGVISLLFAMVMALLAAHMRVGFWSKAAVLAIVMWGVESLQALIEAAYFADYLHLPMNTLVMGGIGSAVKAVLAAVVAAWLWRSKEASGFDWPRGLWWKFILIIPLYIVAYFGAGALIAWQGAELRDYYQQGMQIDQKELMLLQAGRSLIWAALALLIVASVHGGKWLKAGLVGLSFAVFMAVVLLYPTDFMPWAVRRMHLVEVFVSNLLFGIIAGHILLIGRKS